MHIHMHEVDVHCNVLTQLLCTHSYAHYTMHCAVHAYALRTTVYTDSVG